MPDEAVPPVIRLGHKACGPLDGSWPDRLLLPFLGFPFHKLLYLLQPLCFSESSASSSALYSATMLHPGLKYISASSARHWLPTSIQDFTDAVKHQRPTWSRQVGMHLKKLLIEARVEHCLLLIALPTMIG